MTPHEYAKWFAEHGAGVGALTPEQFAADFARKLGTCLGRKLNPPPVVSVSKSFGLEKAKYQCRHCKTCFGGMSLAWKKHHEEQCGELRCEHCCQSFKTPLQLKGHLVVCEQHANNRCEFCAWRLTPALKRAHEQTCPSNPALWCDWCGLQFQHPNLRLRHQRMCPRSPAKFCDHCHQLFPSSLEARLHGIFCKDNPSGHAEAGVCAACCENRQCMSFPCRSHLYCAGCIFAQVKMGLKDRSMLPLRCCRHEVKPGDPIDIAIAQMLPEAGREKYQETMLLKISKDVMYCPQANCGALIVLDELRSSQMPVEGPHGCPKCQQALCFSCKAEWHAGMSCKQFQYCAAKSRDAITEFCRQMNWMRCFECGHVVEKKHGCNHITCICGAQFCYLCGSKWGQCGCQVISEGHLLRHHRLPGIGNQHSCRWCQQVYPSQLELQAHARVCRTRLDQEGGAFECASCLSRFRSGEALRGHRRQCAAAQRGEHICPECNVKFEQVGLLRRHRRICGVDVDGC